MSVAYLGPEGSFSDEAARLAYPTRERLPLPTIGAVFRAVSQGRAVSGVAPSENSIGGGVSATLDALLEHGDVTIQGELVLEISQCLASKATALTALDRVYSHPQGLAQCGPWLERFLPRAEQIPEASTSHAARRAAGDDRGAAISSRLAASLYGLGVLRTDIQGVRPNQTRFLLLGTTSRAPTGKDRTSLMFTCRHECGALRRALGVFDSVGINLTRIESRPSGELWEYRFFVDLEGHGEEPTLGAALEALRQQCSSVVLLGSYPRV